MRLNIYNETLFDLTQYEDVLVKLFESLDHQGQMQLIFVDQQTMHQMNFKYRGIDKTTDVLSFENDEPEDDSIGDVFIDYQQALLQADDYGHSLMREIAFLAVHGYLHLIGYDHQTEDEAKKMFTYQEEILTKAHIIRGEKG